MSGKQHKKERKAQREAERRAAAKAERQRNLMTLIVVVIVVGLGGVLVWLSLDDAGDEETLAEEELEEMMSELEEQQGEEGEEGEETAEGAETAEGDVAEVEACEPAPPPESAGADKPTFDEPAQVIEDGVDYRAVIATSCGEVVVDLDEERAPQAVNSFVFLAQQGFYDGLEIFRNAPSISILQTGSGTNDATWQVGYQLPDELGAAEQDGYPPGSLSMANSGPDTSGSQFFFSYGETTLPPDYTKFGDTVDGLDVLRSIGAIEVEGESPVESVYLESVTIETE